MREIVAIAVEDVIPPAGAVLRALGVPERVNPGRKTERLISNAIDVFRDVAQPVGMFMEISARDFAPVYRGEGKNDGDTPLDSILPSADRLALFAVTVGEAVTAKIAQLFEANDFALGSAVDASASEGAEMAAHALQLRYADHLAKIRALDSAQGLLRFSPGYCGWHLSAQRGLFEYLNPDEIGLSLNESCLMVPLKSVSGAIVCGKREIFDFEDSFSFCADCETRSCRERIRELMEQ